MDRWARRSASISTVRKPLRARLVARWLAREVLPSPPTALAIITTRCDPLRCVDQHGSGGVDRFQHQAMAVPIPLNLPACGPEPAMDLGPHDRQGADHVEAQVGRYFVGAIHLLVLQFEESNPEEAAEERAKDDQSDHGEPLFLVSDDRGLGFLDFPNPGGAANSTVRASPPFRPWQRTPASGRDRPGAIAESGYCRLVAGFYRRWS